jgi:hypothetical protein
MAPKRSQQRLPRDAPDNIRCRQSLLPRHLRMMIALSTTLARGALVSIPDAIANLAGQHPGAHLEPPRVRARALRQRFPLPPNRPPTQSTAARQLAGKVHDIVHDIGGRTSNPPSCDVWVASDRGSSGRSFCQQSRRPTARSAARQNGS